MCEICGDPIRSGDLVVESIDRNGHVHQHCLDEEAAQ